MEIKWPNVVAFALVIGSVVLAVKNHQELGNAIGSIGQIGPGHSAEDKTLGLCVLGILCVAGVAIIRLVIAGNKRSDK